MKRFIFILHRLAFACLVLPFGSPGLIGQNEPANSRDSTSYTPSGMNMDAVYERPTLLSEKAPVAVGGYIEANTMYRTQDGISDGLSFQARRLTIFMSASIVEAISFLTEIEFESGGEEIGIEFAAVDVRLLPSLVLRGGIIMNPIGAFNQNHDGPKWEFVNRPDMAQNMLPATWSNPGFGIYGKANINEWIFGYEAYLTNGFDNSIIDNAQGKTFLPASKSSSQRFDESTNGSPLVTVKLALKNWALGELGLSYMGGAYNSFSEDGLDVDRRRAMSVVALDLRTKLAWTNTTFVGEVAIVNVDVPTTYSKQYGNRQIGYYLDIIQPIVEGQMLYWRSSSLNVAARIDFVDWNVGSFDQTGGEIGDDLIALTSALSFRPSTQTVFRLNYRYEWRVDLLGNPASRSSSWLIGISTYF